MPTPTHPQVNVMRRVRGLDPTGLELFFSEADASDTLYVTTLLPTRCYLRVGYRQTAVLRLTDTNGFTNVGTSPSSQSASATNSTR